MSFHTLAFAQILQIEGRNKANQSHNINVLILTFAEVISLGAIADVFIADAMCRTQDELDDSQTGFKKLVKRSAVEKVGVFSNLRSFKSL